MAEDGSLPKVSFRDYNTVQSLHKHFALALYKVNPCYLLDHHHYHHHHHHYNDKSVLDLMGNTDYQIS